MTKQPTMTPTDPTSGSSTGKTPTESKGSGWYDNLEPGWQDRMAHESMMKMLRSQPPLSVEEIEKWRPHRPPEQIERMYAARNRKLEEIAAEEAAKKDKKDE